MSQRQINASVMRSKKASYQGLSKAQKSIIRSVLKKRQNDRTTCQIILMFNKQYGNDWRANELAQKNENYTIFMDCLLENIKLSEKISRIEKKNGLDEYAVIDLYNTLRSGCSYGGSF